MFSVVAHYAELALKGKNRPWFVRMLVRSIRQLLEDQDLRGVRTLMGRVEIQLGDETDWPEVETRLRGLPGLSNFSRATHVAADVDAIAEGVAAEAGARSWPGVRTFRVAARRADKRFPMTSPEIERLVGQRVQAATGWTVDLSRPDLKVHVEVLSTEAFYYIGRQTGAGGLPVGTSGKVTCLLSGGIDSPVAAWRMIRRGCRVSFVHFHSYPILSRTSQDKARELATRLTAHQLNSRLALVPFAPLQQQVVVTVPPPLRVVVYRRLMLRIAERLADRFGASALVTGEVVGQVASQTISNLSTIGQVATRPVLRPLIGFDKEEITREAQALGTYETSIVPDEDCCTLFTPRFPATRALPAAVEAAEGELDVDALVSRAVDDAVVENFRFPVVGSARSREPVALPDRPPEPPVG